MVKHTRPPAVIHKEAQNIKDSAEPTKWLINTPTTPAVIKLTVTDAILQPQ